MRSQMSITYHFYRLLSLATVLCFLTLATTAQAQKAPKQKVFNIKACLADKSLPPGECEIRACASRPDLNREQCKCMRNCASLFIRCYKAELQAGSSKESAKASCGSSKNSCARDCIIQNKTP